MRFTFTRLRLLSTFAAFARARARVCETIVRTIQHSYQEQIRQCAKTIAILETILEIQIFAVPMQEVAFHGEPAERFELRE